MSEFTDRLRMMIQEFKRANPEADIKAVQDHVHKQFERSHMEPGLYDNQGRERVDDIIRTLCGEQK